MNAKISRLCQIQQTPRSKKRLATKFDRSSRSHCDTEASTVEAPTKHWRSWPPFVSASFLRCRSASAISQSPFLASTNAPCFLAVRTLPLSSIPMRLAVSDRLLVGLASAIGAALGAQRMIGEPLLAFAAELGAHALNSTCEDYAAVLNVPVEDIKGFLGAARASIGNLLRVLRPMVRMFAGEEEAGRFVAGAGLVSEDDVVEALQRVREHLPAEPDELVRCCRESEDLAAIAVSLRLNLASPAQRSDRGTGTALWPRRPH